MQEPRDPIDVLASILDWMPSGVRFDAAPVWGVAALFVIVAGAMTWLGRRSMAGLGPTRRWVALGLRLAVVLLLIMALAGARWERRARDAEVIVLHDLSRSTLNVQTGAGQTVRGAVNAWLAAAAAMEKPAGDRIGLIGFGEQPVIEVLPDEQFDLRARPSHASHIGNATDIASAIQLGLAMFRGDARQRLVLITDGNSNRGDLSAALDQAAAQRIPIDVMPLQYKVGDDVIVEHTTAPAWRRQGEPLSIDVIVHNLHPRVVRGRLRVLRSGQEVDLDPRTPGMQTGQAVRLVPGLNRFHLPLPAVQEPGVLRYAVRFEADDSQVSPVTENDTAETFTVVRGQGRVLWVSGEGDDSAQAAAGGVPAVLRADGMAVETIGPIDFPRTLLELQAYDAVVLDNVPRGAGGLGEQAAADLARYVHDLGGGLLVIGGPMAYGAGGWIGSALERVLPVDCDIPAQVAIPRSALVIVLDRSGSMGEGTQNGPSTKQELANEAAARAIEALSRQDAVGVIAFDTETRWIAPLADNTDPQRTAAAVRSIAPGGGTAIFPALREALRAIKAAGPSLDGARHVLLVTDGRSPEPSDSAQVIAALRQQRVTLSTVGIGPDPDAELLARLAQQGGGRYHAVADPSQLVQIFIREVRVLRRAFIQEKAIRPIRSAAGMTSPLTGGLGELPALSGMVLTRPKDHPTAQVLLRSPAGDPLLVHWQSGLGQAAGFTSDAGQRWSAPWLADPASARFWPQVVRAVARQTGAADLDVRTIIDGGEGRLVIESNADDHAAQRLAAIHATLIPPEPDAPVELRPVQTGPGRYEATFDARRGGGYIAAVRYVDVRGRAGTLLGGAVVSGSPELREMSSNDAVLHEIVTRTGGRMLPPFDPAAAQLFSREGLPRVVRAVPLAEVLLVMAMATFLLDVANRRLAWDSDIWRLWWVALMGRVRGVTAVPHVASRQSLDALQRVRGEPQQGTVRRFDVMVERDDVAIGPATSQPPKPAMSKGRPSASQPGDPLDGLIAAKRRAQQKMQEQMHKPDDGG